MTYRGYFSREQLGVELDVLFPFVEKPAASQLMYFDDGDRASRIVRGHMEQYKGPSLPKYAVLYMHDELSNLSGQGMAWYLPSLLGALLRSDGDEETLACHLIDDLDRDDAGHWQSVKVRYGCLSRAQLDCLRSVLEFLSEKSGYLIAGAVNNLELLGQTRVAD